MKTLLDTSAVLPGLLKNHGKHAASLDWLSKASKSKGKFGISQHTVAELYSVLTGLPLPLRVEPSTAVSLINDLALEVVPLTPSDYRDATARLSASGLSGGVIYDMVHLVAAESFGAEQIVTANPRDFERLPTVHAIEIVSL